MERASIEVGDRVRFAVHMRGTPHGVFVMLSRHAANVRDPGYRLRAVYDSSIRIGIQSELAPADEAE